MRGVIFTRRSGHRSVAALAALSLLPIAALAGTADSLRSPTAILRITSDPDSAVVFLDGARRGSTPLDLEGVAAGVHIVRLVAEDPGSWFSDVTRDTFQLEAGSVRSFHYRLEHRMAVVTIPSGAELLIGDSVAGTTPMVVPFDQVRSGELRVRKEGYVELPVSVPAGRRGAVVLSLTPAGGAAGEAPALVENGSSPALTSIWLAAGSVIVSGTAAAYFKVTADEKNTRYMVTGDPVLRAQRDQRDMDAAVALVAMQVSLAFLISLLLVE